ncbi:hypothetical protein LBMAG10_11830 [Actinomycetes bacterium]|nr:hypothetical protein LBMAG10_11830 [Actinomycetes bacterium]
MLKKEELASELIENLSDISTLDFSEDILNRLEVLFSDFMVCVVSANLKSKSQSLLSNDGAVGLAARFASQSAFEDRDDLDWSAVNHPGSVVFAANLATSICYPKFRSNFLISALAGMRASASIAHFFGANHRKRWHITATAGTFGATAAAAASIGLDKAKTKNAFHLAGTNMGGIGQVSLELQGAPRFNRASAAALGVIAAAGAYENIPAVKNLWAGSRGLIEIFDIDAVITETQLIKNGIQSVRVRTFPATGFIQSALLGASQLSKTNSGSLKNLIVEISAGVFPILSDPNRDRWWNLQLNTAAAWASKDPMILTPAPEIEKLVSVISSDIPLGSARITGSTTERNFELYVIDAPGLELFNSPEISWRQRKWSAMVGSEWEMISQLAHEIVRGKINDIGWSQLEKVLR